MLGRRKDLLQYGWRLEDGLLEPIPMKQEPAPPFLMEMKQCGYATGCYNKCCGCVRDGVPCTSRSTCNNRKNPKNCEDLYNEDVGGQVESESNTSEAHEDTWEWDDVFYH